MLPGIKILLFFPSYESFLSFFEIINLDYNKSSSPHFLHSSITVKDVSWLAFKVDIQSETFETDV